MSALKHGSLYKRGKIWWVKWPHPVKGHEPFRQSTRCTDKRAAAEVANRLIQREELLRAGYDVPDVGAAIHELVDGYLAWLEGRARPRTKAHRDHVASALRRFVKAERVQSVDDLSRERAERWLSQFSGRTYNRYRAHLRAWGRWLLERRRAVALHPFAGLDTALELPKRRRRILTPEEQTRLLACAPWHRRILWALVLTTGLRRGEVAQLRWQDVHLGRGLLVVEAAVAKARREQVLPIPASVVALLEELHSQLRAGYGREDPAVVAEILARAHHGESTSAIAEDLRARGVPCAGNDGQWWYGRVLCVLRPLPVQAPPPDALVFGREPRRALTRTLYRDLASAGIPRVTAEGALDFHALRHTFAVRLRERGVHPTTMQRMLRHSDPKLTNKTYQHFVIDGELRQAAGE